MECERVLPLITSKTSYIDTLAIWLKRKSISRIEREALNGSCGKEIIKKKRTMFAQSPWKYRMVLQQPTISALRLLKDYFGDEILINQVHVALDYSFDDYYSAIDMQAWIESHIRQRWHGKQKIGLVEDTVYLSGRMARNNIVIYSDKLSKITHKPCCHIEWRIVSSESVKSKKLDTINSLLEMNYKDFWKHNLSLLEVNLDKLVDKAFDYYGRDNWRDKYYGRYSIKAYKEKYRRGISRMFGGVRGNIILQDLLDGIWFDPDNCLKKIDSDELLEGLQWGTNDYVLINTNNDHMILINNEFQSDNEPR